MNTKIDTQALQSGFPAYEHRPGDRVSEHKRNAPRNPVSAAGPRYSRHALGGSARSLQQASTSREYTCYSDQKQAKTNFQPIR